MAGYQMPRTTKGVYSGTPTGLRYKVRFKVLRPSATTSGKFQVAVHSEANASAWPSAYIFNVADFVADTWTQVEVYVEPLSTEIDTSFPITLVVRGVKNTTDHPNGRVYIGDFAVFEAKDGGALWQKVGSGGYTIKSEDNGQHISLSSGGVTVPTDAAMPVPNGFIVSIYNASGAGQNITSSMQLRLAGTTTSGTSRTLAAYGIATLMKVNSGYWAVSGPGVT